MQLFLEQKNEFGDFQEEIFKTTKHAELLFIFKNSNSDLIFHHPCFFLPVRGVDNIEGGEVSFIQLLRSRCCTFKCMCVFMCSTEKKRRK